MSAHWKVLIISVLIHECIIHYKERIYRYIYLFEIMNKTHDSLWCNTQSKNTMAEEDYQISWYSAIH